MTTGTLNKARVADLHTAMTGHVARGDIPGIVTLIGRGEEIHVDAIGTKMVGGKEPMRRDTIFRSKDKALRYSSVITAVGALAWQSTFIERTYGTCRADSVGTAVSALRRTRIRRTTLSAS